MAVLDLYETRQKAAVAGGISTDQLAKYVKAEAQPRWETLVRLAAPHGINLNWLATGEGPMRLTEADAAWDRAVGSLPAPASRAADDQLLAQIVRGIEEVYRQENARVNAVQLVQTSVRVLDDLVAAYETHEERIIGLKGMLQQLRRDLRQAPDNAASSKRSA